MAVVYNDNIYRYYEYDVANSSAAAYTDCNCLYHASTVLYANDYSFYSSTSPGNCIFYLEWEFYGPYQTLGACLARLQASCVSP
jgi:hypothetical protein